MQWRSTQVKDWATCKEHNRTECGPKSPSHQQTPPKSASGTRSPFRASVRIADITVMPGGRSTRTRTYEATNPESRALNTAQAHSDGDATETGNSISEESAPGNGTNLLDTARLFRRSRRVDFDMPVNVHVQGESQDEKPVVQEGKTVNVSAHGALLALNTPMEIGQEIRLVIHGHSRRLIVAFAVC